MVTFLFSHFPITYPIHSFFIIYCTIIIPTHLPYTSFSFSLTQICNHCNSQFHLSSLLLLIYSTPLGTLSPLFLTSLLFSSLRGYPSPQIRSTPSIKPLIIDNNIWVSLLSCCIFQHVVSSLLNPFSFFLCPLLSKSQNKNKKNDDKQNAFSHLCLLVHLHPAFFRRHFVQQGTHYYPFT